MKKGIAMIIPLIIILGLLLLGEYFVVGVYARKEYTLSRFFTEVKYISESDKIETYVRSFQDAVSLSLIQTCYDACFRVSNQWQSYDSPSNSYQKIISTETDVTNSLAFNTISRVQAYLTDYINFVQNPENGATELTLANLNDIKNPVVDWELSTVTIKFDEITFGTNPLVYSPTYTRKFNPTASINTKMKMIREKASGFIDSVNNGTSFVSIDAASCNVNGINNAVDTSISSGLLKTKKDNFNTDNQVNKIEVSGFKRSSTPTGISWDASNSCCKFNVMISINITDISSKYVVYTGSGVAERNLGFGFFIETGKLCGSAFSCSSNMDCCEMNGGPCTTGATCSSGSCICGVGSPCPI